VSLHIRRAGAGLQVGQRLGLARFVLLSGQQWVGRLAGQGHQRRFIAAALVAFGQLTSLKLPPAVVTAT